MCAVIGAYLPSATKEGLSIVKRLFAESEIRGLHATGLSFYQDGQIHTIRDTIRGSDFFKKYDLEHMLDGKELRLIGHCRYSTSDLEFNQPILNETHSLVHNGVISQEEPERWKEVFGYDFQTRNDSEILLHSIASGDSLERWKKVSVSCCYMDKQGDVYAYRNGKRPLYYSFTKLGVFVASTRDIMTRSSIDSCITVKNGERISLTKLEIETIHSSDCDLQKVDYVR